MSVDWNMVTALATGFYALSFLISVFLVLVQLRKQAQEQFVTGTAATFQLWMDDDFQRAQQWVLYELKETTWRQFVAIHRGQYGERALIRVGSYYNRIGYLVTYNMLGRNEGIVLDTVAGLAIAVWQKLEPLVLEARLVENSTLFVDYERMLPQCYECYVPNQPVPPQIMAGVREAERIARQAEESASAQRS